MQNYIEIWRDVLEGNGWEESGWNLFTNPRYPRVSVLLYPRRNDGGAFSHKWEVRVDDKPYTSGMSLDRLRSQITYSAKKWEDPNYVPLEKGEPDFELTDEDRKWLGAQNITAGFITIPLGKLSPPNTKVAISVPELVSQTNSFSVKRRPNCNATLLDSNPKQLFLHYNVKCQESYSDPSGHDVRVKFDVSKVEETQNANDLDVQLNCSCPAFLYWGAQWNLHQRDGLLDQPRPELVAPTQKLDLRGNFVICKHCKTVLERILPSVQHNMINIIREKEVAKNKEQLKREIPEKLKNKQDEMKKRLELKKLRETKNKSIQKKLLDALRKREEEQTLQEVKHDEDLVRAEEGENPEVVGRDEPATAPVVETPKNEDVTKEEPEGTEDLTGLVEQEEHKLQQQQHKKIKNQPHLHKGLPYETEKEKEEHGHKVPTDQDLIDVLDKQKKDLKKRKQTSLEMSLLAAVVERDNADNY